jgi:hypothetical protein
MCVPLDLFPRRPSAEPSIGPDDLKAANYTLVAPGARSPDHARIAWTFSNISVVNLFIVLVGTADELADGFGADFCELNVVAISVIVHEAYYIRTEQISQSCTRMKP